MDTSVDQDMTVTVEEYRPALKPAFEALNREWLERYFWIEPIDERLFADPEGQILDRGGAIFFVLEDGVPQGTCAMIPQAPGVYELAKMGVAEVAQGRGYGSRLMEAALGWARARQATHVVLNSASRLTAALGLYRKYGFRITRRGKHPDYERGDLGMTLRLNDADRFHQTVPAALAQLPTPNGERFTTLLEHGTLAVELYAPRGHDPQTPHTRDEIYVVAQGQGMFVYGDTRLPFGRGDMLFVPAGVVHRFEDFTDDLAVWVFFYGPEGGEQDPTDR